MKTSLLSFAASTLLAIGCTASGQVRTSAHVSAPSLVYISSDVQVIEDYREPIFYTSNYYWRYDGGVWYRSSNYTRGWVRVQVVPVAIRRIERPTAYIHYRAAARASTRNEIKAAQKEQRQEAKAEQQAERQEAKAERQEAKAEQQAERRENKAEQQAERKEAKAEQQNAKPGHNPGKK